MKAQVKKIWNEREDIITDAIETKIIRNYYEQWYTSKLDNVEEIDEFLEAHTYLDRLKKK